MSRTGVERPQKMLPTEAVGIVNILEGDIADTDKHLKERLPIINCECGAEILLVPDLQAMNRAIKTHVVEHRKTERRNTQKNEITASKIDQLLSQLTLTKVIEKKIFSLLIMIEERSAFMRQNNITHVSNIKTIIQHPKKEI
jgi:hypothetical protein